MAKTVFITGASSGIGRATALLFQQKGWTVIATMRNPEKAPELAKLENVYCLKLDVTDSASIAQAVTQTLQQFGAIAVLVNNAGYALTGAFEACTPAEIRRQFETNVFGLMEVTRSLLPQFRAQQSGVIVNVASMGGRLAFPLYSPYHGTKWAVEGFSESLQYELAPFNIRVKIIEPGVIKTDFYDRSATVAKQSDLNAYDALSEKVLPRINQASQMGEKPEKVAQVIYQAATDQSRRLRYTVGLDAKLLLLIRRLVSDGGFSKIVRSSLLR